MPKNNSLFEIPSKIKPFDSLPAQTSPLFEMRDLLIKGGSGLIYNIKEALSTHSRRPQRGNPSVLGKLTS